MSRKKTQQDEDELGEPTASGATSTLSLEWRSELEDRISQLERGEVETVSWGQVEATIRATLQRR